MKASDNEFPSILIVEGTEPSAPSAGQQRLYIDSTTHKLKRTNSSGTDVTIEGGSVATDTIFDAKGDLAVGTAADTAQKLTVGTNGYVLTADSGETTGIKWATPGTTVSAQIEEVILDSVLGADATFTWSISADYDVVRIFGKIRSSANSGPFVSMLYFNADTTNSNYNGSSFIYGPTNFAGSSTNSPAVGLHNANDDTAGYYADVWIEVLGPQRDFLKSFRSWGAWRTSGNSQSRQYDITWDGSVSTDITAMTLKSWNGGDLKFEAGSWLKVVGLRTVNLRTF